MKIQDFILLFLLVVVIALQSVKAQDNLYPNEIESYEFYKSDKFKGLSLANSTGDDIVRIFGKDCYAICDYSNDWQISFFYSGKEKSITRNGIEQKFRLSPEFEGKVWSIKFRPKNQVSFSKTIIPETFKKSSGGISHFGASVIFYRDSHGLTYAVCDGNTKDGKYKKGDLIYIEYEISEAQENKAFFLVEQYSKPF